MANVKVLDTGHPHPNTVRFVTDFQILDTLESPSFRKTDTEKLALCVLAKTIFDNTQDRIYSISMEKPPEGKGSIITIQAGRQKFNAAQVSALTEAISGLIDYSKKENAPLIDEVGLCAIEKVEAFVPDPNSPPQNAFAILFNQAQKRMRADNGGFWPIGFDDQGPGKPFSVTFDAQGACMDCRAATTSTLRLLHKGLTGMFTQCADILEGRTLGTFRVMKQSQPAGKRELAYTYDGT